MGYPYPFYEGDDDKLIDSLEAEVKRLRAVIADVVTDYGAKCCDDLRHCTCSMARAHRLAAAPLEGETP